MVYCVISLKLSFKMIKGCCGRDRMVLDLQLPIYAISAYHYWSCEFESRSGQGIQHYVIKFVCDLRQVCAFLLDLQFPSPIKLRLPRYSSNIVESGIKHHQTKQTDNQNHHLHLIIWLSHFQNSSDFHILIHSWYSIKHLPSSWTWENPASSSVFSSSSSKCEAPQNAGLKS